MCGIVGLYLKNPALESRLGELFEPMLLAMTAVLKLYASRREKG